MLEDIDIIETKNVVLNGLNKTTKTLVPLKLPIQTGNIEYPTKWAVVEIPVEKFTEVENAVPLRIINAPPGFKIKTFPSEVKLKYNVALSQYNNVKLSDFEVVADYSAAENLNASRLTVKLLKHPSNISQPKLITKKVEFILHKEL